MPDQLSGSLSSLDRGGYRCHSQSHSHQQRTAPAPPPAAPLPHPQPPLSLCEQLLQLQQAAGGSQGVVQAASCSLAELAPAGHELAPEFHNPAEELKDLVDQMLQQAGAPWLAATGRDASSGFADAADAAATVAGSVPAEGPCCSTGAQAGHEQAAAAMEMEQPSPAASNTSSCQHQDQDQDQVGSLGPLRPWQHYSVSVVGVWPPPRPTMTLAEQQLGLLGLLGLQGQLSQLSQLQMQMQMQAPTAPYLMPSGSGSMACPHFWMMDTGAPATSSTTATTATPMPMLQLQPQLLPPTAAAAALAAVAPPASSSCSADPAAMQAVQAAVSAEVGAQAADQLPAALANVGAAFRAAAAAGMPEPHHLLRPLRMLDVLGLAGPLLRVLLEQWHSLELQHQAAVFKTVLLAVAQGEWADIDRRLRLLFP